MTANSVATALTLYRSRTLTLEEAATAGGCTVAELQRSARTFTPVAVDTAVAPPTAAATSAGGSETRSAE
ncbi:hypothetical protein JCM17823_15960 [Halorubrum gandharaense]